MGDGSGGSWASAELTQYGFLRKVGAEGGAKGKSGWTAGRGDQWSVGPWVGGIQSTGGEPGRGAQLGEQARRGGNVSRTGSVLGFSCRAFPQVISSNPLWPETGSDLPKVTRPVNGRARTRSRMFKAKALVLLAASRGSGKMWESMNSSLSTSITAAPAILCFPRSPWRRKGAGTSPWQRFSSGQAGKGARDVGGGGEAWPGAQGRSG